MNEEAQTTEAMLKDQVLNILLVEDNPGDILIVSKWLDDYMPNAHKLSYSYHLSEAIQRLSIPPQLHCILLDLGLPDSEGIGTLERMVAGAPGVPIIVYSGNMDETLHLRALLAGAQDFLIKGQLDGSLLTRSIRYAVERRKAEENRLFLQTQLTQAQKMEAIGRLAGGVAHDFNNILSVIVVCSEFILEGLDKQSPLRKDAAEILSASHRATAITRQLLAFTRKTTYTPKVVDLAHVLTNVEGLIRRTAGENILFRIECSPVLWHTRLDPSHIEQAFMNLAVHARDSMPHGGNFAISLENLEITEANTHQYPDLADGRYVHARVADTGSGMNEEMRRRIFDPVHTGSADRPGAILGMAAVHEIIARSGGHILVTSEPWHGTTFDIFFNPVDAPLDDAVAIPDARLAGKGETILVVEDDHAMRTVVSRTLLENGYTVYLTSNGEEARDFLNTHRDNIDLIIADVIMPQMSSEELSRSIAISKPGIRMILMSGYPDEVVESHGGRGPDARFIQKPFSKAALLKTIRSVIDSPSGASKPA